MNKYTDDKQFLMGEIQALVRKNLESSENRRESRRLKLMLRGIKKLTSELKTREKLEEQSAAYMEEQRKKTEEYYASDPSNRDQ